MNLDKIKNLKKSDLSISILLVIGIIAVINFFAYQIFVRWDLTQNKVYSISEISKDSAAELDDIVNIKAYFSDNLPPQFIPIRQEVGDLLDEYKNYSKGKVKVEFISPDDDEETMQDLYMKGIPQLTFQVIEKDKAQVAKGYMGMVVSFGKEFEAIPAIQNTKGLEYQITSAIKKVTSKELGTIGFVTSNGTASLNQEVQAALGEVQKLYKIEQVDLSTATEIPSYLNTLVLIGPKEEFTEDQLKTLDKYLVNGGSMLVLYDGMVIGQGLQAEPNNSGLGVLLEKYGVKVNQDLVADVKNTMASFSQGFMTFTTSYPYWPQITNDRFNQDDSAVSDLESLFLQWASSIDVVGNKDNISVLAKSTNRAVRSQGSFDISPNSTPQGEQGQYNFAVSVNGGIQSAYGQTSEATPGRLIVVSDSDFVRTTDPDNITFFQNLVDSLSLGDDLIKIRSKNVSSRPIQEELSDSKRATLRYLNVFGVTVLVFGFGLMRYYMRRRKSFSDEL